MSPEPSKSPSTRLDLRLLLQRWQGVALTLVIGSVTLWLALTDRLVLYIHPRYIVFTVIMLVLGMLLSLVALAVGGGGGQEHDGEHEHSHGVVPGSAPAPATPRRPLRHVLGAVALLATGGIAAALVVLPPATLSSATATTRDVASSTLSVGSNAMPPASNTATAKYTVLEWATQLRQTTSLAFYEGKQADVTGFISPSPRDPVNTFIVTRFVITCCAVDAQPVGLLVYSPHWQGTLKKDEWVRIRGGFAANPSSSSAEPIALVPRSVSRVAQPRDPYLS